jgi:serine protease AprX
VTSGHRRPAVLAAAAAFLGLLGGVLPTAASARGTNWTVAVEPGSHGHVSHLDPGLPTTGPRPKAVIVTATDNVDEAAAAIAEADGEITAELPIVHGFAATVPANRLEQLADDDAVGAVTADREAQLTDIWYDDTTTASGFTKSTGATGAWATGNTGNGIGVAIIDTGASDMNDLAGHLVHGPDLSGEGRVVDTYGHGTVMAGIVGGSGADSAGRTGGAFTGIAPGSTIVPVKVAGRNAAVDVSTVLQAMHWVSAYQSQYNIRVVNLSWGVPSTQNPSVDPIDYAVERLWKQGIVVVVAAGNDGPHAGTLLKPADDPLVLTVGAYDDNGNTSTTDDALAAWSARGPTAQGLSKPDVVAPGRKLTATRSFGSFVEQTYPKATIAPSYIRGSGSSEAAAVVSGLTALLLAQRPTLTPDQVKYLFRSTALPMSGYTVNDQGTGRVRLGLALTASVAGAPTQTPTSTGLGSIEASRGDWHVDATCNGVQTTISGEIDARCEPWNGSTWTGSTWTGDAWTGSTWTGSTWTGSTWTGSTWTGGTWTGASWQGSASWTGSTWTGSTWTGSTWTGSTWTGSTWTGASFTGENFTSALYEDEFQTAFWGNRPPYWQHLPGELSEQPPVERHVKGADFR